MSNPLQHLIDNNRLWAERSSGLLPPELRFEVVVSNPPYVRSDDLAGLQREVQREPRLALDGGPDGLQVLRRIVAGARERLQPGGLLALETSDDQGAALVTLLEAAGYREVAIEKDLARQDRLALARAAASRAQIDVAQAAYYPSVSASANANINYNNFSRRTTGLVIAGRAVDQETSGDSVGLGLGANLGANIPIYDFGRTGNAVGTAERAAQATAADTDAARVQAMGAVASAYLTVLSDQESIAAARITVRYRNGVLNGRGASLLDAALHAIEQHLLLRFGRQLRLHFLELLRHVVAGMILPAHEQAERQIAHRSRVHRSALLDKVDVGPIATSP